MTTNRLLILALSFLTWNCCLAQKRYLFKTYTTREGLINNTIFSINQDKLGYIWIATDAGVSKFNGYSFNNSIIPEINQNEAFCQFIDKDSKDNLVISSFMQGVLIEQSNGSYKQFLVTKRSIGKNVIRTTKACADGRLLVSLSSSLFELKKDSFELIYKQSGSNRNIVNSLEYDQHKNIWFGGYLGLAVIFAGDTTHSPFFLTEFKDKVISVVLFDKNQNLLVGTKSGFYTVKFKNFTKDKLSYTVEQTFPELNECSINHIYIDHYQNMWLSTTKAGVFKIKDNKILENISSKNGLPAASVMCMFQDRENNYWFGTPEGVSKLVSFASYSFTNEDKHLEGIGELVKDKFNRLWLWDGVSLFIKEADIITKLDISGTRFEKEGILSFFIYSDNVFLVSPQGLFKMPLKEKIDLSDMRKIIDFEKAGVSKMRCRFEDSDGTILLGFEQGVYAFKNNKLVKCEVLSEKKLDLRPVQILKDKYGYYWMGDFSWGLYRMKLNNVDNQFIFEDIVAYKSLKADSSFVTAWVQDMTFDSEGYLWMSSLYTGVYKLKINKNGVENAFLYSTRNGLSSNTVSKVKEDRKHNIWFATQNGADCLITEGQNKTFRYYNSKNGLGIVVYDLLPEQDLTYISYAEGFYAIEITQSSTSPTIPPRVLISNIVVMGKADSAALQSKRIYKLPYNRNFIAFDFASISYSHENGILYQYKLKGVDKNWSAFSDRRFVNYNSLSPGKYVFQVRARAINDSRPSEITEFSFLIKPPFYSTWWFITLICLVVGGGVFLFYQYRVKQLLKLERMRSRIASDLHDDIGSTLSSISILSELLQNQLDNNPKSAEMIRKIGSNARNMLESMDDIIWAVNPSNDKFQNLGIRIREFAIPLFESKEIKFTISIPEQLNSVSIPMHIRRNVYLIIKEAVNNLVKYSECTEALVEFREENSNLILKVEDNGRGFDPEGQSSRNGVRNMSLRAQQINAPFSIRSELGMGTKISLAIKII